jgi:hypothetical protein
MENRVYYGQYSLKHWLELILKGNITLPGYQRFFVWDEEKVKTLVSTFNQKQFVPPITIGAFKAGDNSHINLILDGQQRLTSIFLAYLGLFPDKATFKIAEEKLMAEKLADENDDDDIEADELDNILEWNFTQLTSKGKKKSEIQSNITQGNYKVLDFGVDETFFKNNFLGFSYLVPQTTDPKTQQRYYSSVFRNINVQGQALLPQESRASLYFLNESYSQFFNPEVSKNITIKTLGSVSKADFVRFLSLLAQYSKDVSTNKVARGFATKMESYYEEYIYSVVGERESSYFKSFVDIFPDGEYQARFEMLNTTIQELELKHEYPSIIDLDIFFFGLIHAILFEGDSIDISKRLELRAEVEAKIGEFKASERHKKAPGALKYLKERMISSIEIFNKYKNG